MKYAKMIREFETLVDQIEDRVNEVCRLLGRSECYVIQTVTVDTIWYEDIGISDDLRTLPSSYLDMADEEILASEEAERKDREELKAKLLRQSRILSLKRQVREAREDVANAESRAKLRLFSLEKELESLESTSG